MPNWVSCELIVTGGVEELNKFAEKASEQNCGKWKMTLEQKTFNEVLNFYSFFPQPKDMIGLSYDDFGYLFEEETFGCAGGAYYASVIGSLIDKPYLKYKFLTAWHPPLLAIDSMSYMFPKLTFELIYKEPLGMLGGVYKETNREVERDESYEGNQFSEWNEK
jgi:hypothetical protein